MTYDSCDVTEEELIDGCRRRERSAQCRLYEQHADRIYRVARRITRDADAAFDVTQETFIRGFDAIDSFDGRAAIGTWLYRIATNEALQFLRRRDTEQKHLRIVAQRADQAVEADSTSTYPDVEAALDALSEHDRVVLVLKYQENLSYGEIAYALECAPGTVASRLNRARERLRKIMAESSESEEESGRVSHRTG